MDYNANPNMSMRTGPSRQRIEFLNFARDWFSKIGDGYRELGIRYHDVSVAVRDRLIPIPGNAMEDLPTTFEIDQATLGTPNWHLEPDFQEFWPEVVRLLWEFDPPAPADDNPTPSQITDALENAERDLDLLENDIEELETAEDHYRQAGQANRNQAEEQEQLQRAERWMLYRLPEMRKAVQNGMSVTDAMRMTFRHPDGPAQANQGIPLLQDGDLPDEPDWASDAESTDTVEQGGEAADGRLLDETDPNFANQPDADNQLWPDDADYVLAQIMRQFNLREREQRRERRRNGVAPGVSRRALYGEQIEHPDWTLEEQMESAREIGRQREENRRRQREGNQ